MVFWPDILNTFALRVEIEGSQLHEHVHDSPSITPASVLPAQTQVPISGLKELIGIITQAIAVAVTSAPNFQSQNLDRESNFERARKLGATEFSDTTDQIEAKNWFQRIERMFALMKSTDSRS